MGNSILFLAFFLPAILFGQINNQTIYIYKTPTQFSSRQDSILDKFNFQIKKGTIAQIENNFKTYRKLNKLNGTDWQTRFNSAMVSLDSNWTNQKKQILSNDTIPIPQGNTRLEYQDIGLLIEKIVTTGVIVPDLAHLTTITTVYDRKGRKLKKFKKKETINGWG